GTDPRGIIGCFGGDGYLNASYIRVFAVRTPGLTTDDLDQQFFGESEAPPYVQRPGDKSLRASLRVTGTVLKTVNAKALPALEDDKERVAAWTSRIPAIATASDDQLLDTLLRFKPEFRHLFGRHIMVTFQASVAR